MSNTTGWKCPGIHKNPDIYNVCAVLLGVPNHPKVCLKCVANRHAPKNKQINKDNIGNYH